VPWITTIGLDIPRNLFFLRCMAWTAQGKVSIRRQLKRRYVLAFFQKLQACLVGIESRATSERAPTGGRKPSNSRKQFESGGRPTE
jgi:hypothetical protein